MTALYSFYGTNLFSCRHCGCVKTMANVDRKNNLLPGRLCMKCAEPAIVFEDLNAPWKHSQGPWVAFETTDGKIAIQSESKTIATLNIDSIRQARFDAELMAASPELLHWLNRLVDLIQTSAPEEEIKEVMFHAIAAISKAEKWSA